jgi:hypothetical protein
MRTRYCVMVKNEHGGFEITYLGKDAATFSILKYAQIHLQKLKEDFPTEIYILCKIEPV